MLIKHLAFDLETILDPDMPAYVSKSEKETFPQTPYWKVVCIGSILADADFKVVKLGVVKGEEEVDQITGFVRLVQERRPTLITFNGRGFDIPVITARCMRYGISFPYRFTKSVSHRYGDAISGSFDVMDHLSDFGATKPASLDAWARLIGMPGKGDTNGNDVAKLYAEGQLDKIRAYCLDDVVQHYAVALRVHLLRGLPEEGYIAAMKSLLVAVESEPMVSHMIPKMNVKRLLLEHETQLGITELERT